MAANGFDPYGAEPPRPLEGKRAENCGGARMGAARGIALVNVSMESTDAHLCSSSTVSKPMRIKNINLQVGFVNITLCMFTSSVSVLVSKI